MYTVHPIPYCWNNMLFNDTVLLNNLATYLPHRELSWELSCLPFFILLCCCFGTVGAYMPLIERGVYLRRRDSIHHFQVDHNAPYLPHPPPPPPQILHHRCFQFLPGITAVPREIEDNGYAQFCGVDKVHYCLCENGEFHKLLVIFPGVFSIECVACEFCILQVSYRCLNIFSVFPPRP